MDEIEERAGAQLHIAPPQHLVPAWVQLLEIAVETGDAQHVERVGEETVPILFCPPQPLASRPQLSLEVEHPDRKELGFGG